MSLLRFSADPRTVLVADASVVINLNATGRAADIIKAYPGRIAISGNAISELEDGERHGHGDARKLHGLIAAGLIHRVEVGPRAAPIYEFLIDGSARLTLDDGEAATIACAVELAGVALLDERKARSLCIRSFAALPLGCTAELLLHQAVAVALGVDHIDVVVKALKVGRMRVPPEFVADIATLIGPKRAAACLSLPRTVRQTI